VELIPAIDLLDGAVVRLHQGDFEEATVYAQDPVAQAREFAEAGATRLHVVDLDGARLGEPCHLQEIEAILRALPGLQIQVGGGIRSVSAAERWLRAGAARVVLGTVVVREPAVAEKLCREHVGEVVVALDARGEDVAVEAWQEASGQSLSELARTVESWGAAAILYTDIARDGTGHGPATARTVELQNELTIPVIASGGIGRLDDLGALAAGGVRYAVCGRALYEGKFTFAEAQAYLGAG
jgi:phosphoribosylformimino-5-aminoimidazole carboxamide ribotide isomerase